MTVAPAVTDDMLDLFENAETGHTFTHGGGYRRCCYRAGLEAVAPLIAAQQLASDAAAIRAEVNDLKASGQYQPGYVAGFEDAAEALETAADEVATMLAERGGWR